MTQTIGKIPTRPFLPKLPPNWQRNEAPTSLADTVKELNEWSRLFHEAIATTLWTISKVLVFAVSNTNAASFGAATTSVAVVFDGRETDAGYQVLLTPSWDTRVWWSSKTVTGFTITVSTAPGGSGGTVDWIVTR